MSRRTREARRAARAARTPAQAPARTRTMPPYGAPAPVGTVAAPPTGQEAREAVKGLARDARAARDAPRRVRLAMLAGILAAIGVAIIGAGIAILIAQHAAGRIAGDEASGAVADARAATVPVLRAQLADDNAKIVARNLGPGFALPPNATADDYRRKLGAADAVLYLADLGASRGQSIPGDTGSPVPGHVGGGLFSAPGTDGIIVPIPSTTGIPGLGGTTTSPGTGSSAGSGGGSGQATVPTATGSGGGSSSGGTAPAPTTSGGGRATEQAPAPAPPAVQLPAPLPAVPVPAVPLPAVPLPAVPLPSLPGVHVGLGVNL